MMNFKMPSTITTWLCAAVVTGTAALTSPDIAKAQGAKDFGGEELLVQTYGGTLASYFRDNFAKEFNTKYNARVEIEEGLSTDTVAKLRAARGFPHVDVFMVTEPWAAVLEAERLVEPVTAAEMPALLEIDRSARQAGDTYVRFCRTSMTIAYNTQAVKKEDLPKTWKDLADPKYKGKVTLPVPGNAHAVMLIAKLTQQATGSLDNINPAIATLKELGPNVLTYWTSFDQAFNLLNSGETWISVTSTDRTIDQALKGAPVKSYFPEEGTTFVSNTVGIAKGSTHGKLAEAWINFLLEKEQQGRIASNLGFSPVRSDVAIDPKVAELLPSGKALESSLLPNWGDISKKQAGWIERYTKEVAGR